MTTEIHLNNVGNDLDFLTLSNYILCIQFHVNWDLSFGFTRVSGGS